MNWKARKRGVQEALDYEDGLWDMFEALSSAYYGKQYYFLQDDNLAYSRASHQYMTIDAAVLEFAKVLGWDGE